MIAFCKQLIGKLIIVVAQIIKTEQSASREITQHTKIRSPFRLQETKILGEDNKVISALDFRLVNRIQRYWGNIRDFK